MTNLSGNIAGASRQQSIRAKCFHPTGRFVEFKREEIEQSIPDRFEQMVRLYPDRIAVKMGDEVVTYAELNAMANHVARKILSRGVKKSEPILLLLDEGPLRIASMLGVWKTGSFFTLLDPLSPKERCDTILDNAQANVIVFDRRNAQLGRELTSQKCSEIEIDSIGIHPSDENLSLPTAPTALAFINYTSGSTGKPKGVVKDHRVFLHHIMLYTNAYSISAHDRLGLMASGTGRALNDTFMALANGATLLPLDVRKEGMTSLEKWLTEEKISIWSVSAPLFRSFCKAIRCKGDFRDLRLIRLGSEAAYKDDFDAYKKYFPHDCLLANGLDAGESGFLCTFFMDHATELATQEVPIGYPVDDKEILLLDDEGNEAGLNKVGEIVVRSRYVSLGYWNRPELTEAKFKPDPQDPEKRLYYTGDAGLMLPDGCLIHKGRKDFRVKIRGYGVDLIGGRRTPDRNRRSSSGWVLYLSYPASPQC